MGENDKSKPRPFDEELVRKFQAACQDAFLDHPELRSVAIVFDYMGGLNDAEISKGIWVSEDGAVKTLEGIHGSLQQLMRMMETMFVRASALSEQMREQATVIGQELVRRKQELETMNAEEESSQAESPTSDG